MRAVVSTDREASAQVVPAALEPILDMAPLHSFSNAALSVGAPAVRAGERAARLGYVSRAAECHHAPDAHEWRDDVIDALDGQLRPMGAARPADARDIMHAAARLTPRAPRSPHDEEPPLSVVPGLDPAARREVASAVLHGAAATSASVEWSELLRAWTYGYLVHVMAEVSDFAPAGA